MKNSLLLVVIAVFMQGCATSPLGRSQLAFMPEQEMNQMGLQAFDKMKAEKPIEKSRTTNRFVQCIANAITRETGGDWEVVVFNDQSANAFALPSGKIGVHTGLLKVTSNQDQLAAVIGHEVGHVLAQHSNERMSTQMVVSQGVNLVGAIAAPQSALGQVAVGALGIGAQYGVILPYSRTHESEADKIGLDLMAKAGFDPRESVELWMNMNRAAGSGQSLEILSTHPSHETRIQDLNNRMADAMELFRQARSLGKNPSCGAP